MAGLQQPLQEVNRGLQAVASSATLAGSELYKALSIESYKQNLVALNKELYNLSIGMSTAGKSADDLNKSFRALMKDTVLDTKTAMATLKEMNTTMGGLMLQYKMGSKEADNFAKSLAQVYRENTPEKLGQISAVIEKMPFLYENLSKKIALTSSQMAGIAVQFNQSTALAFQGYITGADKAIDKINSVRDAFLKLRQTIDQSVLSIEKKNTNNIIGFLGASTEGANKITQNINAVTGFVDRNTAPGFAGAAIAGTAYTLAMSQLPRLLFGVIQGFRGLITALDRNTAAQGGGMAGIPGTSPTGFYSGPNATGFVGGLRGTFQAKAMMAAGIDPNSYIGQQLAQSGQLLSTDVNTGGAAPMRISYTAQGLRQAKIQQGIQMGVGVATGVTGVIGAMQGIDMTIAGMKEAMLAENPMNERAIRASSPRMITSGFMGGAIQGAVAAAPAALIPGYGALIVGIATLAGGIYGIVKSLMGLSDAAAKAADELKRVKAGIKTSTEANKKRIDDARYMSVVEASDVYSAAQGVLDADFKEKRDTLSNEYNIPWSIVGKYKHDKLLRQRPGEVRTSPPPPGAPYGSQGSVEYIPGESRPGQLYDPKTKKWYSIAELKAMGSTYDISQKGRYDQAIAMGYTPEQAVLLTSASTKNFVDMAGKFKEIQNISLPYIGLGGLQGSSILQIAQAGGGSLVQPDVTSRERDILGVYGGRMTGSRPVGGTWSAMQQGYSLQRTAQDARMKALQEQLSNTPIGGVDYRAIKEEMMKLSVEIAQTRKAMADLKYEELYTKATYGASKFSIMAQQAELVKGGGWGDAARNPVLAGAVQSNMLQSISFQKEYIAIQRRQLADPHSQLTEKQKLELRIQIMQKEFEVRKAEIDAIMYTTKAATQLAQMFSTLAGQNLAGFQAAGGAGSMAEMPMRVAQIESEKNTLARMRAEYAKAKASPGLSKDVEQQYITGINAQEWKIKGMEFQASQFPFGVRKSELGLQQTMIGTQLTIAQAMNRPLTEQMPLYMGQIQTSYQQINNLLAQKKNLEERGLKDTQVWRDTVGEVAAAYAGVAEKIKFIRTTWEQQYTEVAFNMGEASNTVIGSPSFYQLYGSGAIPWGSQTGFGPRSLGSGGQTSYLNQHFGFMYGALANMPQGGMFDIPQPMGGLGMTRAGNELGSMIIKDATFSEITSNGGITIIANGGITNGTPGKTPTSPKVYNGGSR